MGHCPLGFPGCSCADDRIAVLCEDGSRIENNRIKKLEIYSANLKDAIQYIADCKWNGVSHTLKHCQSIAKGVLKLKQPQEESK